MVDPSRVQLRITDGRLAVGSDLHATHSLTAGSHTAFVLNANNRRYTPCAFLSGNKPAADPCQGSDTFPGRFLHSAAEPNLVERDLVEENLHVFDRIYGDAGHTDVASDARMIRVVAAVRR